MARTILFATIVFTCLMLLHSAEEENKHFPRSAPFRCGKLGMLSLPFATTSTPEGVSFPIHGCNETVQKINIGNKWLNVKHIWSSNPTQQEEEPKGGKIISMLSIDVEDSESDKCDPLSLTPPTNSSFHLEIQPNTTFLRCSDSVNLTSKGYQSKSCGKYNYFYDKGGNSSKIEPRCSVVAFPVEHIDGEDNLLRVLKPSFQILLRPTRNTRIIWPSTTDEGREVGHATRNTTIICPSTTDEGNHKLNLKIELGIGFLAIFMIGLLVYFFKCGCKRKHRSTDKFSTTTSKVDLEEGSVYYGVPVFSYNELEEATKNFDDSNELGKGGFGIVYYGKLKDGREVAVKRLFNKAKRVEQFMNEIEILTRLRHTNLVSLYGYTPRQSRELLLVYEYIPNGTVADHLHGNLAKTGSLAWSTRMSIAIETAKALAYLHASDIIHRDIKTNNILLHNNFSVKVADFGISRLFPIDVTHVSTPPQGTFGYLDPDYYHSFQLTDKSDVFSFGVVLVELISSMPAVDISRHTDEIGLRQLAIAKIKKRAYNELVDPTLDFESDSSIRKMVMMVADLAFRCLQLDKKMRPSMDEVLEALQEIKNGKSELVSLDEAHTENI